MVVRRIRADEVEPWREIRLRALAGAPDAFASTYADSVLLDIASWRERARSLAEGRSSVMFVADDGAALVGMAGAFLDPDDAYLPHLISMWVAPEARRRGLGEALARAVIEWARGQGFKRLRLFVVRGNTAAAALYARCGFRYTGHVLPMPRKPDLIEEEMRLDLN